MPKSMWAATVALSLTTLALGLPPAFAAEANSDDEPTATAPKTAVEPATSGSLMAVVPGKAELSINGARLAADRVVYFYFANNGRTSFSVQTDAGAVGFSGDVDDRPGPHLYTLTIDSIVRTRPGKEGERTDATGQCQLSYGDRQTEVSAIDCKADTGTGPVSLSFTGNGQPAKVTHLPDGPSAPVDAPPN